MTPIELRAEIARLSLSQVAFADALVRLGDVRPRATILRTVQELARPGRNAPIPWSVAVLVRLMAQEPQTWRR